MKSDIVVVGGGIAGVFAAAKAALDGAKVVLIEKMPEILYRFSHGTPPETLTNDSQRLRFQSRVTHGADFMEMALKLFSPNKLLIQLEGIGIPVKIIDGEYVFPGEPSSVLAQKFQSWLNHCGVKICTNAALTKIISDNGAVTGVVYSQDNKEVTVETSSVVLACGGIGVPELGANGDGFRILEELGHHVLPPRPALAPLKLGDSEVFGTLTGLNLPDARLYLWNEGKKVDDCRGTLRFIESGISGSTALDLSAVVLEKYPDLTLTLELLPFLDEGVFDKELISHFETDASVQVIKILSKYLPKRLCKTVLAVAELPENIRGGALTTKQRKQLRATIYRMPLNLQGTMPVEQATDTAGGADLSAVNPETMGSYVCAGLFIAGELLDISTRWGGYSMHCAIATGRLAGMSAVKSLKED